MKASCNDCMQDEEIECAECDRSFLCVLSTDVFREQELNDILSAISFFLEKHPDRKGSVQTRKAMSKLEKKVWRMVSEL